MASYNNSNYSNDFFDLTGVYFNSTSQTNSNINIDELDIRYLQKTGGTISNNLLINGSLDIQTSLTLPIGNIATLIESKQDIINDGSLSISKTLNLQSSLTDLQDDIDLNITNILTKQNTITSSTNLTCNSLTTNHLEVNNIISTPQFFDTIVVRRPTAINGIGSDRIGVKELQCWVNGVNIMVNNGLTSYFSSWLNKEVDIDSQNISTLSTNAYNNIIDDLGALSSSTEGINSALIIKNIPYTHINNIQALVFYSRDSNDTLQTTVGLGIELYNSIKDPTLINPLATTPVITSTAVLVYRYNFPSIDTYTDFVGANSLTNIVNNTFSFAEEADVISYTEITGDVIMKGDLTVENIIVGSTNIITELTSLDTRLDAEEPKTTALQTLTEGHTDDIASNTAAILTKQDTLDFDSLVEGFNVLGNLNFSNPADTLSEYLDYGILNTLRLRTETFETTLTANNIELAGNLTAENLIVGSTNVITEINTKQDLIDISITLEGFNISENINFLNSTNTDYEVLDYGILNTLRLRNETFETTLTANNIELAGDLTAENLIVGSTNVITELTSLDTLTASHTEDLATNTANILTKQATITDGSLTIARTDGLQAALDSTAKLASANIFTTSQEITGNLKATLVQVSTTTPALDTHLTSKFYVDKQDDLSAKLASANTFTANQSITGDLSVSGLITQSNTIRFKAYYNTVGNVFSVSAGNNIPYNTTQYDVGNGYDSVNYKYVVPVAGTYFFGGTWFKSGSTSAYTVDYQKNGVTVRRNECSFTGGVSIIPTFLIEDCVVGDEMRLRVIVGPILVTYNSTLAPNGWTHFEGYRIG